MTLRMRPMRPMRSWGGMAAVALACGLVAAATAPSLAQQKTAKQCAQEWRADKAANQAKGITEKAYVAQCRSGAAAAQPTAAPTAAPTTAPAAQHPATAPATGTATAPQRQPRRSTTAAAPAGENQFTSEAQAKSRCGSDQVVWVNEKSKVYHFSGTKSYGTTKQGAYMCERDAQAAGDRAAKNEKHP